MMVLTAVTGVRDLIKVFKMQTATEIKVIVSALLGLDDIVLIFSTCLRNLPCRVGSVGSVSASRTAGREFASWPGHTKDHHKNGTNCLPA